MTEFDAALDESLTPGPPNRTVRWTLAGILAAHLALALWLGWPEPGPTRWWDERFNVLNLEAILAPGGFELANGYYGGVSYLPQAACLALGQKLHDRFETPAMVNPAGYLTASAYHLLRTSQALWGSATLLLLFLLAIRLMRPELALLAVALAAVTPRLYHSSAIFKPDIELVAATLLSIYCSWRAAEHPPRLSHYLLAGAAIGLAVGAKLNGIAVAFPLTLATLLTLRSAGVKRRLAYLALAGVTSFLTFWAFNPDLPRVLRSLEKNQEHYERTASDGGSLDVLVKTLSYPFSENFHRPWVAMLGLFGFLLLTLWLFRHRESLSTSGASQRWLMVLSYPPAYYLLYAVASPRAKANHFLQIIPFVALGAAVSLGVVNRRLARSGFPGRRWLIVGLLASLIVPPLSGTTAWIHSQAVPSTWDQAQDWIEANLPVPSRAYRIGTLGRDRRGRIPRAPVYQHLAGPTDPLDDLDGLLMPRSQLESWTTGAAADWVDAADQRTFTRRFLRARDESVVALLRPHRRTEHADAGRLRFHRDEAGTLRARLPSSLSNRRLSLRIRLGVGDRWAPRLGLEAGGLRLPLTLGPASGGDIFLLSPRFDVGTNPELSVTLDERELQPMAKAELFVWEADP